MLHLLKKYCSAHHIFHLAHLLDYRRGKTKGKACSSVLLSLICIPTLAAVFPQISSHETTLPEKKVLPKIRLSSQTMSKKMMFKRMKKLRKQKHSRLVQNVLVAESAFVLIRVIFVEFFGKKKRLPFLKTISTLPA